MAPPPLSIDVFSDVVCPWCYLGKRRLERALAGLSRPAVVRWRPFRLDPTIPPGGIARDDYLQRKFGSVAAVEPAHRRLTALGRDEGIDYRFDLIRRSPNTIDAHRLVHWTSGDRQDAMVERLFRAYFTEGRDVGDRTVLAGLAAEAGLEGDIAARLASDEDRLLIEGEIEGAYRLGIDGVPCFVLQRRWAVTGAQTPDVLVAAIAQADSAGTAGSG
jgi:predicted DsbA family dithiol-disulfide isomerase